MLALKHKTKLEALPGKTFMYHTTTYRITGIVEVNGQYIISTDVKPLRFTEDAIPQFLSDLLPVETRPAQKDDSDATKLNRDINPAILGELTASLMDSLRQIDTTTDPEKKKDLNKKIKMKVAISRAATDIAKTAIIARRFTS